MLNYSGSATSKITEVKVNGIIKKKKVPDTISLENPIQIAGLLVTMDQSYIPEKAGVMRSKPFTVNAFFILLDFSLSVIPSHLGNIMMISRHT